jgi:hypothetical protein
MTKKIKFDISKVLVNFDCVITNDEIRKAFLKHLDLEKNKENFEFFLNVLDMKNAKLEKESLKKKVMEIYNLYISKESKYEINLSNKEYSKIEKKIKEEDYTANIFDNSMQIVKNEIQIDAFPRFIRTPECIKLVEKYQNDDKVVTTYIKKNFLYTNKDFEIHLVTEKDISLMKAMLGDSFDYKHVINKPKYKYNMYLSMDAKSFIPKFDFMNTAGFIKSTYIAPLSLEKTLYYYYDIIKNQPLIVSQEDLNYLNNEDLNNFYEKIPENLKLFKNEKVTKYRTNYTSKVYIQASKIIPLLKSTISVSMDYDEKNEEVFVILKMVTDENQIKDYQKVKKEKIKFKDGKIHETKSKGTLALYCNWYKKLDENRTSVANIILVGGFKSKPLNHVFFKYICTKALSKNHLKIIKEMQTYKFKEDIKFSNIFDDHTDKNLFYKQIQELEIDQRRSVLKKLDENNNSFEESSLINIDFDEKINIDENIIEIKNEEEIKKDEINEEIKNDEIKEEIKNNEIKNDEIKDEEIKDEINKEEIKNDEIKEEIINEIIEENINENEINNENKKEE